MSSWHVVTQGKDALGWPHLHIRWSQHFQRSESQPVRDKPSWVSGVHFQKNPRNFHPRSREVTHLSIAASIPSESCSVMSNPLWLHGLYSPWNSPGQNTGVGSPSLLQGIFPNPGIEPRSPALQMRSLPAEPQGTPKNTGVGSLSLLQWIFLTQELTQDLLHCRQILYQLSYQASPY